MSLVEPADPTVLMNAAAAGDKDAAARLRPMVYDQLRAANPDQILAVNAALVRLESEDPEASAVVRLRFDAGLSMDEVAQAMRVSARTAACLLFRLLSNEQ